MLSNKITILIINYKAMQIIIKDIQFENWVKARTEGLEVLEVEQYA